MKACPRICPRMCQRKANFDFTLKAPAVAMTINDATVAAKPKSRLFQTTKAQAIPGNKICHL